jgi:hypothetical protein
MIGVGQRGLQATFVVRVRHEPGTPAGEWRGEVEHVQTARQARFADPAGLSAFVCSQLAEAGVESPANGRRTEAVVNESRGRRDTAAGSTERGGSARDRPYEP